MASEMAKRQMETFERLGATEKLVYRPAKAGLRMRTIVCMVNRLGNQQMMNGSAGRFEVTALNDETDGIPADDRLSDANADRIDIAERRGGDAKARMILEFADASDADWVVVRCA